MRDVAVAAWFDTPSLIVKSATLRAAIAGEIAHSHAPRWRTRDLLLAPYPSIRPIAGGIDPDASLVLEVLATTSGAVCLDCLVRKTWVPALTVADVLQRFNDVVTISAAMARCDGCLRLTETYTVSDRTDMRPLPRARDGNGNGTAGRLRPPDLTDSLWRFLAEHRGEMFCTQCLAKALLTTRRIDRVVLAAEGRGALRRHGVCGACGKDRLLCGLAAS
jgi:hypothetical protein